MSATSSSPRMRRDGGSGGLSVSPSTVRTIVSGGRECGAEAARSIVPSRKGRGGSRVSLPF
ncbi:MAG: hypothetical protein ACYDBP_06280 [Leptospirales bacterium]